MLLLWQLKTLHVFLPAAAAVVVIQLLFVSCCQQSMTSIDDNDVETLQLLLLLLWCVCVCVCVGHQKSEIVSAQTQARHAASEADFEGSRDETFVLRGTSELLQSVCKDVPWQPRGKEVCYLVISTYWIFTARFYHTFETDDQDLII